MTSIFRDGALHPGRDANDAWWIVVRRPEDWGDDPRPAGDYHTRYDASRCVLELMPRALEDAPDALAEVSAPDGTRYWPDSVSGRILRQRPCDARPEALPGVGGLGFSTGRFQPPLALATDERGWLYAVDRGNHRVQVIDPSGPAARVVIVLGHSDGWGRPLAGDGGGALRDPVSVAVGARRVYVAAAKGWIQAYDREFRLGPRFRALRPGAADIEIVAIAAIADDGVVVAEAGWSRASQFDCDGRFVREVALEATAAGVQSVVGRTRFELEGTRVVGPIDGGSDGLAWHQVIVDALVPAGASIEVQTWAADAVAVPPPASPSPPSLPPATAWAPSSPVALPGAGEPREGESVRPILSDTSAWERWRRAPYHRGATWSLFGDGPSASATWSAAFDIARRLRAGDELELRTATATTAVTVAAISPRRVSLVASGARVVYGAGTTLSLLERDGRAFDAPEMGSVPAGESIDLTGVLVDGGGTDITWPHACAALLRRGDVLELSSGALHARVEIEAIEPGPATLTLAAPVAGDFRTSSLRLVQPLDRLVLEQAEGWGDGFPPGSNLDVTYQLGSELAHASATVKWSDPELATLWTTAPPPATWIAIAPASAPVATDRGRYLWIKLRLRGARRHPADSLAVATPEVRSLRAVAPRLSYLSYLPAVFGRRDADAPTGSVFIERYLALFEGCLTRVEGRYESVVRWLNPKAADDEWLAFLASWFELALDPAWPRAKRARLLSQIFEIYKLRGTREGILRVVEAYTDQRPELIEGFQVRPRSGMVLGCAGVLGCSPLGGMDVESAAAEDLLASYAHRFTLVVHIGECDRDVAELSLRALVETVKPAHADVELRLLAATSRVGLESTVGLDFVLGETAERRAPLGGVAANGELAPILGVGTRLVPSSAGAPVLDGGTSAPVGSFTLQ